MVGCGENNGFGIFKNEKGNKSVWLIFDSILCSSKDKCTSEKGNQQFGLIVDSLLILSLNCTHVVFYDRWETDNV